MRCSPAHDHRAVPMDDRDVAERLARFAGRLRERGVGVCLSDEIDGAAALLLVDLADRDEVRYALRTALKIRRSDWDTFDELLRGFWAAEDTPARRPPEQPRAGALRPERPALALALDAGARAAGRRT